MRLEHLAPAEGEQLLRQPRRALAGAADLLDRHTQALLVAAHGGQRQVAVAVDDREQVVEVVRDPACEAADRLELLVAPQLLGGELLRDEAVSGLVETVGFGRRGRHRCLP